MAHRLLRNNQAFSLESPPSPSNQTIFFKSSYLHLAFRFLLPSLGKCPKTSNSLSKKGCTNLPLVECSLGCVWIWVFKSWLDVEWSLEASVAELVAAHPHPLQEAAGNERPWAWVWLVQRCGSPGGSTCPLGDTRSSDYHGPHPRERPGASAVLGTSSPCQGWPQLASRAHGSQRLPQEQTSEALAQHTASNYGL